MKNPEWLTLNERDRAAFQIALVFLNGRLEERATINWALKLDSRDIVKRLAARELLARPGGLPLGEPWRSAWHLIEESWRNPVHENRASTDVYQIKRRLNVGDRSGSLVEDIVELVVPRLALNAFSEGDLVNRKLPKRPQKVDDLLSSHLTCNEVLDLSLLNIGNVSDRTFLLSLAFSLDAAVVSGLDVARRIGWDGEKQWWILGLLNRVYYVPSDERRDGEHEPDEFHRGLAPSVKLLHAVVARLVDLDTAEAIRFVRRWKLVESPIHLRLWAALSRDSCITPAAEVATTLLALSDERFWDLHKFSEIAELRAKRFVEFLKRDQNQLIDRIRRGPPRNQWPKKIDAARVKEARRYWSVRELQRIELAKASLPQETKKWFDEEIKKFPDLLDTARLDEGFLGISKARFISPNPDIRFDTIFGQERLKALEAALTSGRIRFDDDPAGRASDWIRQEGRAIRVLADFESLPDGGAVFFNVWERFGWTHSPTTGTSEDAALRDISEEANRVLRLIEKLPPVTLRRAIDGFAHWLSTWEKTVAGRPTALLAWLKLWPIAVELANVEKETHEGSDRIDSVGSSPNEPDPMDLDTLNSPLGKLVGVFLQSCPAGRKDGGTFPHGSTARIMRDAIEAVQGRSGTIAKYRLIEHISYFLSTDRNWTLLNLVPALLKDGVDARILWRAVARHSPTAESVAILIEAMIDRAVDVRLNRETRRILVFRIVVACLHALREGRESLVTRARVQQMIRLLDDEVRAAGAEALQRFVLEVSAPIDRIPSVDSPGDLFRIAVRPFLRDYWPQDRSLATRGVSRALADLPATAKDAFADAVDAIEHFLVPFDCWSLLEFGLFGEEEGGPKLSLIDNHSKASALLRLLDLSIGTSEGAVIPYDLTDALDQIRLVAPDLVEDTIYLRLSTAARR